MKAQFDYSGEEVAAIVLAHHVKTFPNPEGMVWRAQPAKYSNGNITVEAVESHLKKAEEGGEKP